MSRSIAIAALVFVCACAGNAPETSAPPAEPADDRVVEADPPPRIASDNDTPLTVHGARPGGSAVEPTGRKVWEVIPNAPHGQCCTSNDECGKITCEPYEYAHASCERVCTYSCDPGDICPAIGGTLDPPSACPESGLCPVGSPFV